MSKSVRQIRFKKVQPKRFRNPIPSKSERTMRPDIYLFGVGAGLCFLPNQAGPKRVQPKHCRDPSPFKSYRCHTTPDIYLAGLGADHNISEPVPPKTPSTKMSDTQSYQNLRGPMGSRHLSHRAGCWALFFHFEAPQKNNQKIQNPDPIETYDGHKPLTSMLLG